MEEVAQPILQAISVSGRSDPWWPGVRDRGAMPVLGGETDALAVDEHGRLLVIEAKPPGAVKGIAWSPAQVLMYASLFANLVTDSETVALLNQMLSDRVVSGLSSSGPGVGHPAIVVPVVAIGEGKRSAQALSRLAAVHEALTNPWEATNIEPLEVWVLDASGTIAQRWRPVDGPPPS